MRKRGRRCGGVNGHGFKLWISGFRIVNIIWTCSFESMSFFGRKLTVLATTSFGIPRETIDAQCGYTILLTLQRTETNSESNCNWLIERTNE